jgi:hypothetical protein
MGNRARLTAATASLLIVVALAACGSTVNRPLQLNAGAGTSGEPGLSDNSGLGSAPGSSGQAPGSASASAPALGLGGSGGGGSVAPGVGGGATAITPASPGSAGGPIAPNAPIQIGIVRTNVSNAAAFGASVGNTVSEASVDDAVVSEINDEGGVAGHHVIPIYADTDTGSTSWDANFAAACASFTQDHHVAAVLGYVFNFDPSFESCLATKGIPHLSTSFNVPNQAILQQLPLLIALSTPRIERRSIEKIDGGLATGVLTKVSRIGVLIDSCPGTEDAWNKITKPYILSKGLTIASVQQLGCAHGEGDAASEAGQAGNVVLQFRTAGVDRMMFDAVSEGPALFVLANAAESQGWHPQYLVSSLANAATAGGQIPADQAANVKGYGWMPMQDVNPPQWPGLTSSQQHCAAMLKKKGVSLSSATDYSYAFNICDAFFLYQTAVAGNANQIDGRGVVAAIERLGSSFVSAENLNGKATFAPGHHDGPSLARYFTWDTGCSCFTYRSTYVPIS